MQAAIALTAWPHLDVAMRDNGDGDGDGDGDILSACRDHGYLCKHATYSVHVGVGNEELDKEGRHIDVLYPHATYSASYVPNSGAPGSLKFLEKKLYFLEAIKQRLLGIKRENPMKAQIWGGDMNVALYDNDKFDNASSPSNVNFPSCHPKERNKLKEIIDEVHLCVSW